MKTSADVQYSNNRVRVSVQVQVCTGFIRGILRGVRYAKSLRVLFLHRWSPSWTTLVLYSRVVFIFNEPTARLTVENMGPLAFDVGGNSFKRLLTKTNCQFDALFTAEKFFIRGQNKC
jgi:hypothetical protein